MDRRHTPQKVAISNTATTANPTPAQWLGRFLAIDETPSSAIAIFDNPLHSAAGGSRALGFNLIRSVGTGCHCNSKWTHQQSSFLKQSVP